MLLGIFLLSLALPATAQAQECIPSGLVKNQYARITEGSANRLREEPNREARLIGEIPGGSTVQVLSTNQCTGNILWALVIYDNKIGWTAEAIGNDVFVLPIPPTEGTLNLDAYILDVAWSGGRIALATSGDGFLVLNDSDLNAAPLKLSSGRIDRLHISPSNLDIVAVSSGYGLLEVWDVAQGTLLYQNVLGDPNALGIVGNVTEVVGFSADGTRLLVQEPEDFVLLETSNWQEVWRYPLVVDQSAFSLDGSWIAYGNYDDDFNFRFSLMDAVSQTISPTADVSEKFEVLFSISFSPDGRDLFVGDNRGNIERIPLTDGLPTQSLASPSLAEDDYIFVSDFAFSPEGNMMAVAMSDRSGQGQPRAEVQLYQQNQLLGVWRDATPIQAVNALTFSPDGTQLALVIDGTVALKSLFDFTAQLTAPTPAPIESQTSVANLVLPTQSATPTGGDGVCGLPSRLFVGQFAFVNSTTPNRLRDQASTNGTQIGQVFNDQNLTLLEGPVCNAGFTWWLVDYKGQVGWTIESTGDTYVLDGVAATPTPVPSLTPLPSATPTIPVPSATPLPSATPTITPTPIPMPTLFLQARALAWSSDGQELAVLDWDGVHIFSRAMGVWTTSPRFVDLVDEEAGYSDLLALPDGRWMVLSDKQLFEISTDGMAQSVLEHGLGEPNDFSPLYELSSSADGTRLLISSWEVYEVYDTQSWQVITRQEGLSNASATLSPDGQSLALSRFGSDFIELLDVSSGAVRQTLDRGDLAADLTGALIFSVEGRRLAVGDLSGNIQTWDIATGERVSAIRGGGVSTSYQVTALGYSPDGRYLVSAEGSPQGVVRVYDAALMRQVFAYGVDSGTRFAGDAAYDSTGSTLAVLMDYDRVVLLETATYTAVLELYAAPALIP